MPHHRDHARRAERDAARAQELAQRTDRRAQPRQFDSLDPSWQASHAHEDSAARMRSSAAALRASAEIEQRHEDAHGDIPTADGETPDDENDSPTST